MAIPSSELDRDPLLRLLVMGGPKSGKTSCLVCTSPGPVRVFLCEDDSALKGARRGIPVDGDRRRTNSFDFERIGGWDSMQKAITELKKDLKEGAKLKTLLIDPLGDFVYRLLDECFALTRTRDGNDDGRRAYPELAKRMRHLLDQLFRLPVNVIVVCHYTDTGGQAIEGQLERSGQGIVPNLPGQVRATVAAKFVDVIWFEIRNKRRIFVTGPEGAWGPGCRSMEGTVTLDADVAELIKLFESADSGAKKRLSNNAPREAARR